MSDQNARPTVRVQLVRAEPHHISTFRLSEAGQLAHNFGKLSHLPQVDGTFVPVPYGSLENYAHHLANEWGDADVYVMLVVTTDHCGDDEECYRPDPDTLTKEFQGFLQSLPQEERHRIRTSLGTSHSNDQPNPDHLNPNNCPSETESGRE